MQKSSYRWAILFILVFGTAMLNFSNLIFASRPTDVMAQFNMTQGQLTAISTVGQLPGAFFSIWLGHMFDKKGVIVFAGEDADAIFEQLLEADVDVEDVEAEDGTITVYTEPTDLHKALEALRANGQEEFQVTELEMIPQTEVTLEGEDLEVFEGLIDALEADDDVQKVYHNVADM